MTTKYKVLSSLKKIKKDLELAYDLTNNIVIKKRLLDQIHKYPCFDLYALLEVLDSMVEYYKE